MSQADDIKKLSEENKALAASVDALEKRNEEFRDALSAFEKRDEEFRADIETRFRDYVGTSNNAAADELLNKLHLQVFGVAAGKMQSHGD